MISIQRFGDGLHARSIIERLWSAKLEKGDDAGSWWLRKCAIRRFE
jgi:hypothetical protein